MNSRCVRFTLHGELRKLMVYGLSKVKCPHFKLQLEKISVTFLTDAMTSRFINVITGIVLGMYKLFRLIVHEEACERSRAGIRLQNLP
ncbi:hypothetical protein Plhal304r1_c022g0077091 [Plasmopara halstedii]